MAQGAILNQVNVGQIYSIVQSQMGITGLSYTTTPTIYDSMQFNGLTIRMLSTITNKSIIDNNRRTNLTTLWQWYHNTNATPVQQAELYFTGGQYGMVTFIWDDTITVGTYRWEIKGNNTENYAHKFALLTFAGSNSPAP